MFLKKIPPVNFVLFVLILGVIGASIYGLTLLAEQADNAENNYVESTFNKILSRHYTDSFSRTPIGAIGKIEISIYDSVENMDKPFVLCSIITHRRYRWSDMKRMAVPIFLGVFPNETWFGEFNYQVKQPTYFRSATVALHPIQLESNNNQDDDDWE
ncbi:hypothetical protein [Longitalea luteola]|uniref:hypothetical protein n=1 Tax=Longitalea luteola TaxID=2812563 RepID=UPI001A95BFA1|nr:hypothetical protein [Longitalea luteola]